MAAWQSLGIGVGAFMLLVLLGVAVGKRIRKVNGEN